MTEGMRAQELIGLDEGLRVRHIATSPIMTCLASEDPSEVFARPTMSDFDQIPVRDGSQVVAVLERSNPKVRRRIDDSVLVSADELLSQFIHTLHEQSYRLVVDGTRITGIVTWSDLLKTPVLVLAYSVVAELELAINRAIRNAYGDSDHWISELSANDKRTIEHTRRKLQKQNLVLAAVEVADIAHKAKVVRSILPTKNFDAELDKIVRLRNATAHVKELVCSSSDLKRFVDQLETAESWLKALRNEPVLAPANRAAMA
jgi:hypothetical protein